jgi:L-2-hydroxyglutarate oxidase LhgO
MPPFLTQRQGWTKLPPLLRKCYSTFASTPTLPACVDFDAIVIGAGVIGLAVARRIALDSRSVLVLEQAGKIGTETSSRNSEVIHAGIYYAPQSWKARLCVQGRQQLYAYCRDRGVDHRQLGKLIVATEDAQLPALKKLRRGGISNGVQDLHWLSGAEATALEPAIACKAALFSPSTGIVDSHGFMTALQADIESDGGTFAFHSRVIGGDISQRVKTLIVEDVNDGSVATITSSWIVNAAGLHAQEVSSKVKGIDASCVPELFMAKGRYFSVTSASALPPFKHLIYPLPGAGGLGVHLTLDLGGGVKFGPDVEWLPRGTLPSKIDYDVDHARAAAFEQSIRSWCPSLPPDVLEPGYAGVRPKVVPRGASAGDFVISGPRDHNVSGVVALYGIESPGLTASLALADVVAWRLEE